MKYALYAQHVTLSDYQHRQVEEKIGRLSKLLKHPLPLEIAFTNDSPEVFRCHLSYGQGKDAFHAENTGPDIEDALDGAIEKLRRELVKQQEKQRGR